MSLLWSKLKKIFQTYFFIAFIAFAEIKIFYSLTVICFTMYTSVWNWQIKFRCHHYMWIIMIKSNILFRYRFQKILPYNAYMYVCRSLESARILVTQTSTKSAVLWKHWTLPRNMCESVGVRTRRWKTYLVPTY